MPYNVTLNGTTYTLPDNGDTDNWGTKANGIKQFFQALAVYPAGASYQPSTGSALPLTAVLDFGTAYGIRAIYHQSGGTNTAASGVIRLAVAEGVTWRNYANNADLTLTVGNNSNSGLVFNGINITSNPSPIYSTAAAQSFATGVTSIVNYGSGELDGLSAVTTGASWRFTCPNGITSAGQYAGQYVITASVAIASAIASGTTTLQVFKNGTLFRTIFKQTGAIASGNVISGSTGVYLLNNDYIDVRFTQNSGGAIALTSTTAENAVSIARAIG